MIKYLSSIYDDKKEKVIKELIEEQIEMFNNLKELLSKFEKIQKTQFFKMI